MATTMFQRYGGFSSVSKVVSSFYDKILDSPVVSGYFANSDMKRLIDHQTKFISYLMGGPASYSNDALERAHAKLNIDEKAFKEVWALLRETLEDFDFEGDDIAIIEGEIRNRAKYIVTSK